MEPLNNNLFLKPVQNSSKLELFSPLSIFKVISSCNDKISVGDTVIAPTNSGIPYNDGLIMNSLQIFGKVPK